MNTLTIDFLTIDTNYNTLSIPVDFDQLNDLSKINMFVGKIIQDTIINNSETFNELVSFIANEILSKVDINTRSKRWLCKEVDTYLNNYLFSKFPKIYAVNFKDTIIDIVDTVYMEKFMSTKQYCN